MAEQSWISLDPVQASRIIQKTYQVHYNPGYLVVPKQEIPDVISPIFREKCDSAVLMTSTGPNGILILVWNSLRVDEKARAIDQEPFAIARLSTGQMPSGLFLHHGNWHGRTSQDLPPGFWEHIRASGIGNYFPQNHLPQSSTGSLGDLFGTSHANAFYTVLDAFRNQGLLP
jgi:hypothetical protein